MNNDFEEGEYQDIPKIERKIITEKTDPPIKEICERLDKNKMVANPDFQRNYVWGNKPIIQSRLIESVLLNVPIPVIYTAETENGKEEVIDGQQRVITFHSFKNNDLILKGLTILSDLNGKRFRDLSEEIQDTFLNRGVTMIKILLQSQKDIKFEIFVRLNRGSVRLNEQELRNCLYRGNFNNLIKELRENKDFLYLQNLDEPNKRMIDGERILRFFAFCDNSERNYKSPLKKFLNDYIEGKRDLSEEELEVKRKLFKKCVELCQQVFGNLSFKRYYLGNENEQGRRDSKMNEGLMDIQLYGFKEYDKREIVGKEQVVKDAFIELINSDKEVVESIEKGTYGTPQVKLRTEKWINKLREIVGYPSNDRRIYTTEEKELLFKEAGEICQICKNKIHTINDAHVDHIERFSEGGKTTLKNGQITHRYCNLKKG